MSYQVVLTRQAKTDLAEIFRYIAVELRSRQNAEGQISRLEKEILSLEEMPERYRIYDDPKWRERNLRILPVDNYVVLYIPSHENATVTIMRILYGGRDIPQQLSNQ